MDNHGRWTRRGECNHCGWCCQFSARSVAVVTGDDGAGLRDPEYYRVRGFRLEWHAGVPIRATSLVQHYQPCPQHTGAGCALYADRPQTCRDFPWVPRQIVGTQCSYWFERDDDGALKRVGGLGSPYPMEG